LKPTFASVHFQGSCINFLVRFPPPLQSWRRAVVLILAVLLVLLVLLKLKVVVINLMLVVVLLPRMVATVAVTVLLPLSVLCCLLQILLRQLSFVIVSIYVHHMVKHCYVIVSLFSQVNCPVIHAAFFAKHKCRESAFMNGRRGKPTRTRALLCALLCATFTTIPLL
jgi:hypothetical protein